MESQYQKWVNLSYLAFSAILAFVVFTLSGKIIAAYDLETRIRNIDLLLRGISLGIGVISFFLLYRDQKINQFMNEVVAELNNVTWPNQKDTGSATLIVIVMVIISGVILGLLDNCWTQLLRWIL